ncbi:putative nucleic acid-binding protein [Halarchaeum solikamskense]|uniref:twitching motility protein PilT n=1 Tax=Halarchaeum nitratireducens TaxID=489913 RepID=UPI001B3AFD53|nr:twitching motility protein PilT [Halarchaeum solikamskense]MBP2252325.1 putative nucleic acid-binding protein [Halarchaeum solikamskense]
MTGNDLPANPSVLNTTVLSNFAYIDQLWVVASLSGICTVPVVREELEHGVDNHSYLQEALDMLDDEIPVAPISDTVANREAVVGGHLDPGEAQAFALADAHDGRLLTDDGDARSFAKDQGVTVVGSVGVLLAAIDAGKIDEATADGWLSTWIDEIGYYVPYRTISEYR